jgi:MFS family permease
MNIGAFFPHFAYNHHGIEETSIGILFSVYQVAFLFTAIWAGKNMEEFGYRKIMIFSIALMTTSTFMFGLASKFRTTFMFYTVSLFARVV